MSSSVQIFKMFNHTSTLLLLLIVCLASLVDAAPQEYRKCDDDSDCSAGQCCAATPNSGGVCLAYESIGQQCYFFMRTPSCGCSPGLRCVSTTPEAPGRLGDQYVCSKRRPQRRYKFAPNDDHEHYNQLTRFY